MHRRVALIAYSFRFPGTDAQNFWHDLLTQKDLITEVDPSRWSKASFLHPDKRHPGTSYSFAAGSLGDISGFDAAFFGVSPREAALIDPQQRLLLELAWETFENAGIVPSTLRGSRCGVYIGISNVDYAYRLADDMAAIEAAAATGIISSIAANRISYVFDLHGPSISMDTACSSSLVAFHQACQAIRAGEIVQALAGGINLHLHPYGFISFSKATMLSKTGRCHVFDEAGDGYVRSEGGGLFLLKDYEQALKDGDPILAVVAGSGVNTDGHKSGLTIPNPKAQADLMAHVYQQAGINPDTIDYFEAHGTGTAVGDPIEAQAIGLALGKKRKNPLLIGSVKSNLGHLESASGVAGLVKALNCLQYRTVPATIGIKKLNSKIDFADLNLQVVTQSHPLKPDGELTIGINSFGFGGANAHVILQSNPSEARVNHQSAKSESLPLLLSAKDLPALKQAALEMAGFLEQQAEDQSFYDIAYTALFRREHHQQGALLFSNNASDAALQLKNFATAEDAPQATDAACLYTGVSLSTAQGPVFVYSGNGCQWAGMGKQLLVESASFRRIITKIDRLFSQYADFSLLDELSGVNGDRYQLTEIAQPTLFALQVGITELLKENGISPKAVMGHSVGEVAAAWASGALSLAEAVKVIYFRSRHQGQTAGLGGMTAVGLGAGEITKLIKQLRLQIHLAGINSYRGVTIAGDVEQLALLETELLAGNIFYKRLDLNYAFHSPAMDAIEQGVRQDLSGLAAKQPLIPFFSTVTGAIVTETKLDGGYWWHNIRQPVQFQQAAAAILNQGFDTLLEIGAHPVLQAYLNDSFKEQQSTGCVVPTVLRNKDTLAQVMNSVAQVIIVGAEVDFQRWFPVSGQFIKLPNYPWQREHLWHPITSESQGLLMREKVHPLLGYLLAQHETTWENQLDTQLYPYLADHNVGGAVVFPGAGFVETATAAAHQLHPSDAYLEIEDLEIRTPLLLAQDQSKVIRFVLNAQEGRFNLQSRELAKSSAWQMHSLGRVLIDATGHKLAKQAPQIPKRDPDFDRLSHAQLTKAVSLDYGEAFQAIRHGWVDGNNNVLAILDLPASIQAGLGDYYLHPALLDNAFQLVFQILKDAIHQHESLAFVPVKIGRINLRTNKAVPVLASARLLQHSPHSLNAEFTLYDAEGQAIAVLNEVRFRAIRLHRAHSQHLSYLDYHLTAAPFSQSACQLSIDQPALSAVIALAQSDSAVTRYSCEVEPLLDSLSYQFILEALAGLADEQGFIAATCVNEHDAKYPASAVLLRTMLHIAFENQGLSVVGQEDQDQQDTPSSDASEVKGWQLNEDDWQQGISATAIWNTLIQEYPDYFYLIHLNGRVGKLLPKLLKEVFSLANIGITPALYSNIASHILDHTAKTTLTQAFLQRFAAIIEKPVIGERLSFLEISAHKPEFAPLICPELDFSQQDYCVASFCENALKVAEGLRERFPLLKTKLLSIEDKSIPTSSEAESRSNFAIVHLNMAKVEEIPTVIDRLPTLLMPGSPVFFIGLQPARWISQVLGLYGDKLPQISANVIEKQLKMLNFQDIKIDAFDSEHNAGYFVISARIAANIPRLATVSQNWLILAAECEPEQSLAVHIAGLLSEHGQQAIIQSPNTNDLQSLLLEAKAQETGYDHIIHLSGFAQPDAHVQTERCWLASVIIQACEATATSATVWLLTHNVAQLWPCDQVQGFELQPDIIAHDAALWGFGRSLINEASGYRMQLLDLSGDFNNAEVLNALLVQLIQTDDHEQEVFLNAQGKRFVPRLRSLDKLEKNSGEQGKSLKYKKLADNETLQLSFKLPGQLRNLQWQTVLRRSIQDDEIEVEVKATGLNFRDVMYTLGLLSDEAIENGFVGPTLGLEFAGCVSRVGHAVTTVKPGDPVFGLGPASFSNRVITRANALALMPANIAYSAAATIPSTFFTVYYALHYQARLQAGEKVLIHGAAGGVGLAAIQVAQWLDAEIYATVGSEEKKDFLQLLGIEHIHDSRSLSFAEEILAKTDNRGVDVVLNSLAGEAINRNFQVLKPFGRFLELGKRDFYENTHIGLRPFRNNISYFGIDADQLMQERPELTQRLFKEMMALFQAGVFHPLPYTTFDANQVVDAFRYMQQAKQIGKIVVTYDNGIYAKAPMKDSQPELASLQLQANASYLVTGGLGGFGLRTAQWLVEKGARYLILMSRSGHISAQARALLDELDAQGITIYAAACDVTDNAALKELLSRCESTMPPLKGIIHAAAVIEDSLARNLNKQQIQSVLEPKVQGALNLHALTLHLPLDFFVLYSSVTSLLGNPGQSNYVAANLWLEAFAASRRQQGLPASCVSWGAIDDVGYLARNEKIKEALQNRLGGSALSSRQALDELETVLLTNSSAVGIMEFDWRALSSFLPSAKSPKFSELAMQAPGADGNEEQHTDIKRLLDELSDEALQATLADLLKEELSQILLVNKDRIDANTALHEMGLDSLMGVELMIAIESRFAVQIPVMALSEAPTLNKLANRLMLQLRGEATPISNNSETLANISDLSKRHDAEVTPEQLAALAKSLDDKPANRIIH